VRDVMHSPAPVVEPTTSFHDCLLVMTRSRLGMTVVMDGDKLVGIVTDGDLRRALLDNEGIIHENVMQFMTANPHTILEDAQLSEADAYMIDNKIRALAVTDADGGVVGVVEIFD